MIPFGFYNWTWIQSICFRFSILAFFFKKKKVFCSTNKFKFHKILDVLYRLDEICLIYFSILLILILL